MRCLQQIENCKVKEADSSPAVFMQNTFSYFVKKMIIITLQFWTKDIALKICLLVDGPTLHQTHI